jgi:hypothetical protein
MSDYDRYDFVISMLTGLVMVGTLLLGGPLWTLALTLMIGVNISVFRHVDLPPRRR